jgi:DNA repair exonuclease SbcCD ATPase subunit
VSGFICEICGKNCKTAIALKAHKETHYQSSLKEVGEMSSSENITTEKMREIARDEALSLRKMEKLEDKINELQEKLADSEKLKVKLKEKEEEVKSLNEELKRIKEILPTRDKDHLEMYETLVGCPECNPNLLKRVIRDTLKKGESSRLVRVLKEVCDGLGCKRLICDEEGRCSWVYEEKEKEPESKFFKF